MQCPVINRYCKYTENVNIASTTDLLYCIYNSSWLHKHNSWLNTLITHIWIYTLFHLVYSDVVLNEYINIEWIYEFTLPHTYKYKRHSNSSTINKFRYGTLIFENDKIWTHIIMKKAFFIIISLFLYKNYLLWVHKRTISLRWFFWVPTSNV